MSTKDDERTVDLAPLLHSLDALRVALGRGPSRKYWQEQLTVATARLDNPLDFLAHMVGVDNPTSLWLYLPVIDQYIPPNTVGWLLPIPEGSQKRQAYWASPSGIAQPASSAATFAVLRWYEADYVMRSGTAVA